MEVDRDPGMAALKSLYELLMIDEEWSEWGERSFTWWPHRTAQRAVASPPGQPDEELPSVSWISVETDLFLIPADRWADVSGGFQDDLRPSALSGLVWRDGVLRLRSAVPMHEEIAEHQVRLLSVAAAEQLALAEDWLDDWGAQEAGFIPAFSGTRTDPDDMIGAAPNLPGRSEASRWKGEMFTRFGPRIWEETEGAVFSTGDATGCSIEVPVGPEGGHALYGGMSDLITATTANEHLLWGSGLWLRLLLRYWPEQNGLRISPLELNEIEAQSAGKDDAYYSLQLGSWGVDPGRGVLAYTSFFPNVLAHENRFWNLAMSQINRSRWISRRFLGFDVDGAFENARRKGAEMMARGEAGEPLESLVRGDLLDPDDARWRSAWAADERLRPWGV